MSSNLGIGLFMAGSQDHAPDPRNAGVLIYVNGELVPRDQARISVFDAGFVLGDGVWEGLRLHKGALLFLEPHLGRLYEGAHAIGLDIGIAPEGLRAAIEQTLSANGMSHGAHVRVMVTRGEKSAPNQDPRNALGRPTVVIIAEYKAPSAEIMTSGLRLRTSAIRCTPADMFDMRLNSHSRLNLIMALQQAIAAGGDEALMLDPKGFISSCNATNFFFVRGGEVMTSKGDFCFNGITRANVIGLCRDHGIAIRLGSFALEDLQEAEEAFVTGTFGGIIPVSEIDDLGLPRPLAGPITSRLGRLYEDLKDKEARTQ